MISPTREELYQELVMLAENIELHHSERDHDWLRPEDLRMILRLLYQLWGVTHTERK